MKEFSVEANIENLNSVLDFINEELGVVGCSARFLSQIAIVAEEIFVNIAHYAYGDETGGTVIRVCVGDEVTIEFEDNGTPYNPLAKEDPDLELGVDERQIGGLGIFMVKNMMDAVEYRNEDGKNILTMKKRIEN